MLHRRWFQLAAVTLVALEAEANQTESVDVTELFEPTGDVVYKYIYIYEVNVMNPNTRAFDVPTFVGYPQQV